MKLVLAAALVLLAACQTVRERWFVVAASTESVAPAVKAVRSLEPSWPQATVVATSDCENLSPGRYLVVAASPGDESAAREAAARLGAEVRHCRPKPDSRVALGIPLIDPSILKVPRNVVNWTDQDRISNVVKLAGPGYLWFRRTYVPAPEDPREGRRESVLYFRDDPAKARTLEADCTDAAYAERDGWIALSCARETAADHLLHQTVVFDRGSWAPVLTLRRCREPQFPSENEVACKAESVDSDGRLRLELKKTRLR